MQQDTCHLGAYNEIGFSPQFLYHSGSSAAFAGIVRVPGHSIACSTCSVHACTRRCPHWRSNTESLPVYKCPKWHLHSWKSCHLEAWREIEFSPKTSSGWGFEKREWPAQLRTREGSHAAVGKPCWFSFKEALIITLTTDVALWMQRGPTLPFFPSKNILTGSGIYELTWSPNPVGTLFSYSRIQVCPFVHLDWISSPGGSSGEWIKPQSLK